ncbi:MAG: phosphate signaling complex protein PhoU [Alphaproteobacteria bacterium]|nr:phosphate signaling complex protein PhoU [Pseudomonadota bacterium]
MVSEHTVKSYDDELNRMSNTIMTMGGAVEVQLVQAIQALVRQDTELARATVEGDEKIDELEMEIDHQAMRLLALRQPMAVDLRMITSAPKISSDLERIGDYATNIANRAVSLNEIGQVKPLFTIPRMADFAQGMIKDVLDAYLSRDTEKARAVWLRDEELDEIYNGLFRELLTYMMEDPRSITPCTHLLFIAKNIERIGDHVTNIAETINFLVKGTRQLVERPKGDKPSIYAGRTHSR